jgi:hypothetical protein
MFTDMVVPAGTVPSAFITGFNLPENVLYSAPHLLAEDVMSNVPSVLMKPLPGRPSEPGKKG